MHDDPGFQVEAEGVRQDAGQVLVLVGKDHLA
jgi:hypothetical protein